MTTIKTRHKAKLHITLKSRLTKGGFSHRSPQIGTLSEIRSSGSIIGIRKRVKTYPHDTFPVPFWSANIFLGNKVIRSF